MPSFKGVLLDLEARSTLRTTYSVLLITSGPRLKIKRNDWRVRKQPIIALYFVCPQAADHCALF